MSMNANATKQAQIENDLGDAPAESPILRGEKGVHIAGVTGSSPVSPTIQPIENKRTKARTVQCPTGQSYLVKRVRAVFAYDPDNGGLYRRQSGQRAGRALRNGYRSVCVDGEAWREHRLVWIWAHGVVPGEYDEIDHIDGDRANNRIENLRLVSRAQNQWNARVRKDNTSGLKGVSWNKKANLWAANISINGKVVYLGMFPSAKEAHEAYAARAKEIRGEYARVK